MLIIILTVVTIVVAVLVFAATRPSNFRIARSTRIHATPERIFPLINDLKQWRVWSPYEDIDPELKRSYSDVSTGEGAVYAWEGNNKVGTGRMQITQSAYPRNIDMSLEFLKPFKANNRAQFTLEPRGSQTEVTWALYGGNRFVCRLMGLFMNMDKMIGSQHEK